MKLPYHKIFGSEEPISRNELNVDIARNDFNRRVLFMSYSIETDYTKKLYPIYTFRYDNIWSFYYEVRNIKLDEREQTSINKENLITLEMKKTTDIIKIY